LVATKLAKVRWPRRAKYFIIW